MLLSARPLVDVQGVNSFQQASQVRWTQGDTVAAYFQLVDSSLDTAAQGFVPAGRRYCPASGATLQCLVDNIDDAKKVIRNASQPYSGDPSIWLLNIMSTDLTPSGSCALRLTLTEGAKVTYGVVLNAFGIASQKNG